MERKIACPKCGAENLAWSSACSACGEKLHGDDRAMPAFQGRGVGFWVGFGIGIAAALVFAFAAVLAAGFLYRYRYLPYTALSSLAGILLCWKWPRAAGVELACAGLFQMAFALLVGEGDSTVFWILVNLPIIAAGLLFFRAGRRMQRDRAR
jgi:hypothetical protein